MKKTPFILHEKFRSDNNEQRKERFQKELSDISSMDCSMPFLQDPAPDVASLNLKEGCVMLRMDARVQKEGGRS